MVSIPTVGNAVTPSPADNNRPSGGEQSRTTSSSPSIDPTAQPKFVDRRRNRDRRKKANTPLIDTRQRKDRRRTGRLDIKI